MRNIFHIHNYNKPILSMYSSFNCRDIIFECRCGKRIAKKVCVPFGEPFPKETDCFITYKEFNEKLHANSKKH